MNSLFPTSTLTSEFDNDVSADLSIANVYIDLLVHTRVAEIYLSAVLFAVCSVNGWQFENVVSFTLRSIWE